MNEGLKQYIKILAERLLEVARENPEECEVILLVNDKHLDATLFTCEASARYLEIAYEKLKEMVEEHKRNNPVFLIQESAAVH